MPLELKLNFKEVDFINNKFIVVDNTGLESINNPTGYGLGNGASKNINDNQITTFSLNFKRPDGTEEDLDISDLEFYDDHDPTSGVYETVEIGVNNNGVIENGLYTFELIVSFSSMDPISVTLTQYIYNTEDLQRKVNSEFAKRMDFCSKESCSCNKSLMTLYSFYRALCAALDEQNIPIVEYLNEQIDKILD